MKAKTIYETFRRNMDPKEAMGTGLPLSEKVKPGDILFYKKMSDGNIPDQYIEFRKFLSSDISDLAMSYKLIKYVGKIPSDFTPDSPGSIGNWSVSVNFFNKSFRLANKEIKESQQFTRGLDPRDAMDTGQKMLDKKLIDETKWVIDIKSLGHIYDIEKVVHDYNGFPYVILHYKDQTSWPYRATSTEVFTDSCYKSEDAEKEIQQKIDMHNPNGWHENPKLKESHNFKRGLDPKIAMGTGIQKQILQGMQDIRTAPHVGSINLYDTHLEIYFMESTPFKDVLYKYFDKDLFSDVYLFKNSKGTWIYVYNVIIKPQYKHYFFNCFDDDGIIKD